MLGAAISAVPFIIMGIVSTYVIILSFALGSFGYFFLVTIPALIAAITAAFYWFFISLAEEIYRIKYEAKQE